MTLRPTLLNWVQYATAIIVGIGLRVSVQDEHFCVILLYLFISVLKVGVGTSQYEAGNLTFHSGIDCHYRRTCCSTIW